MKSFQTVLRAAAWITLILICFVTLSPMDMRPNILKFAFLERFSGFAVLGFLLFAAYPQRPRLIAIVILGGAVVLELLQFVAPGRDARAIDAVVKPAGGLVGIVLARWALAVTRRMC
jgi:VanZ family protein